MTRSSILLLLVLGLLLLPPTSPVLAISDPDSIYIDSSSIGVYRNLFGTGDQVVFLRYNVTYSTTPTEPASSTFKMAVLDSSYSIVSSRPIYWYGSNIMGMYLTADQALSWQGNYSVRIYGDPTYFSSLSEGVNQATASISLGQWYEGSQLSTVVLNQMQFVQSLRGETLLNGSGLLNTTGASYATYAIPGLSSLFPTIFANSQTNFTLNTTNYTSAYVGSIAARASPTLTAAVSSIGSLFGAQSSWTSYWLYILGFFILVSIIFGAVRQPAVGFIIGFPSIFLAAWVGLGTYWMTIGFIVFSGIVILFAVLFLLGRLA